MRIPSHPWALATAFCLLGCLIATVAFAASIAGLERAGASLPSSDSPVSIDDWDASATNRSAAGLHPVPDCTPAGNGRRFIVGSQMFPTLNQIPWRDLRPDDVVCIPYRDEPYRHKIHFMTRGAADHPIRLVGLRGPHGERPVIDGEGATTSSFVGSGSGGGEDAMRQAAGLITLHGNSSRNGTNKPWHPGYIHIVGLKIRHARAPSRFVDADGKTQPYSEFAAGIHIDPADNLLIEDCEITQNAIGIFAGSQEGQAAPADRLTQQLTIRGNYIHDNGEPTHRGHHNVHIEAHGCNVVGNFIANTHGNLGVNYMSRCGKEHFQANYLRGGAEGLLMLAAPRVDLDPLKLRTEGHAVRIASNVFDMAAQGTTLLRSPIRLSDGRDPRSARFRGRMLIADNQVLTPPGSAELADILNDRDRAIAEKSLDLTVARNSVLRLWIDKTSLAPIFVAPPDSDAIEGNEAARRPLMTNAPAGEQALYEFIGTAREPWFRVRPGIHSGFDGART